MFGKSLHIPFFKKGFGQKLLGGVKGLARLADNPITQGVIGLVAPELGVGLAAAKRLGVLEAAKNL